jgi:hypothetical protein
MAERKLDPTRLEELREIRDQRFALMEALAQLPADMIFFTQITMEAAEDPEFLDAMRRANIKGALVGVESVTPEGLKAVYKDFNAAGTDLVERLQVFRTHGVHVLGSFIFGLPTDRLETFEATTTLAQQARVTFAQFVTLTPFPGTIDFQRWEKDFDGQAIDGVPLTRYWLLPPSKRPKLFTPHPVMSTDQVRQGTQAAWDRFYSLPLIWQRARCVKSLKSRLAFVLISKLYRQMYANTGLATDSARAQRSARWARWIASAARRLFVTAPMPDLAMPVLRASRPLSGSWPGRPG